MLRWTASGVRAWLHMMAGEFTDARRLLEETLSLAPHNLWAHLQLAEVPLREGRDLAAAARVLRTALALGPHQAEARRQLARLEQASVVLAAP